MWKCPPPRTDARWLRYKTNSINLHSPRGRRSCARPTINPPCRRKEVLLPILIIYRRRIWCRPRLLWACHRKKMRKRRSGRMRYWGLRGCRSRCLRTCSRWRRSGLFCEDRKSSWNRKRKSKDWGNSKLWRISRLSHRWSGQWRLIRRWRWRRKWQLRRGKRLWIMTSTYRPRLKTSPALKTKKKSSLRSLATAIKKCKPWDHASNK